jgi:hypothetical protein
MEMRVAFATHSGISEPALPLAGGGTLTKQLKKLKYPLVYMGIVYSIKKHPAGGRP